jgi:Peptidase M15
VTTIPMTRRRARPTRGTGLNLCALLTVSMILAPTTAAKADPSEPFFQFDAAEDPAVRSAGLPINFRRGRSNLGADLAEPTPPASLSGVTNISWHANAGCLNGQLRGVLVEVAANFGTITVNSTCRSHGHNAMVGGAAHSYHLGGNAVDFRVHGNFAAVTAFLNTRVGGLKHSGGGLFHIDTGPRRPMH